MWLNAIRSRSLSQLDFYRILRKMPELNEDLQYNIFRDIAQWDYYYPVHTWILDRTAGAPLPVRVMIAKKILKHGIQNRKAVAASFMQVPVELKEDFEKILSGESYEMRGNALFALWNSFPADRKKFLARTAGVRDVYFRQLWLFLALRTGDFPEEKKKLWRQELIEFLSPANPVEVRLYAMRFIEALGLDDPVIVKYLRQAAKHFNYHLSNRAKDLLKKITESDTYHK
jgi:aminopeptidase N